MGDMGWQRNTKEWVSVELDMVRLRWGNSLIWAVDYRVIATLSEWSYSSIIIINLCLVPLHSSLQCGETKSHHNVLSGDNFSKGHSSMFAVSPLLLLPFPVSGLACRHACSLSWQCFELANTDCTAFSWAKFTSKMGQMGWGRFSPQSPSERTDWQIPMLSVFLGGKKWSMKAGRESRDPFPSAREANTLMFHDSTQRGESLFQFTLSISLYLSLSLSLFRWHVCVW